MSDRVSARVERKDSMSAVKICHSRKVNRYWVHASLQLPTNKCDKETVVFEVNSWLSC